MKAVVAYGAGDFRLDDVPEPQPNGGAVIRVEAAGICAADRMIYRGDSPWTLSFPFVPGHEFVGTVASVDPEARERWQVSEGDRVTGEVIVPCDECALCRSGRYHLCRRGTHLGSGLPGGWADYLHLPPRARVWRVPPELEPWKAVLTEPLSCGIYAARRADIREGDAVAVAGVGAIGAGALVAAAKARPSVLVALVTSSERAALARRLGATVAVDVRAEPAAARVAEATGERGLDVYLDASGSTESLELGLEVLRPGGHLLVYGVYRRPGTIDWNLVAEFKELEIRGGHLSPGTFPDAIALLASGDVDAAALVTHREPLERFDAALEPRDGRMRVKSIVEPSRGEAA